MAYRCSDGMCGADDCEICGYPEPEEEEDYNGNWEPDSEPEHDEFIERCGVQF